MLYLSVRSEEVQVSEKVKQKAGAPCANLTLTAFDTLHHCYSRIPCIGR